MRPSSPRTVRSRIAFAEVPGQGRLRGTAIPEYERPRLQCIESVRSSLDGAA